MTRVELVGQRVYAFIALIGIIKLALVDYTSSAFLAV